MKLTPEKAAENRARALAWSRANPERNRERARRYYAKNKDVVRARNRTKKGVVGATGEMRAGPCEICGRVVKVLKLDHDHGTGAVRGWLCNGCNLKLAGVDDRGWLALAEAYRAKSR